MTLSWLSNFCLGISTNLTQIKHPLCESDKININELFVSSKYGSRSREKHSTASRVFPYTSFVLYRFLRALQKNRAQSRLLYLLITNNWRVTVNSLQSSNWWVIIISLQSNNLWVSTNSLQSNNTIRLLQSYSLFVIN